MRKLCCKITCKPKISCCAEFLPTNKICNIRAHAYGLIFGICLRLGVDVGNYTYSCTRSSAHKTAIMSRLSGAFTVANAFLCVSFPSHSAFLYLACISFVVFQKVPAKFLLCNRKFFSTSFHCCTIYTVLLCHCSHYFCCRCFCANLPEVSWRYS